MRPSQEEKLAEARRYFFAYQFRQAYHLYHQAFSTLPFQVVDSQLDHMGHFIRVLLELDRMEELKFYIPILEAHCEKVKGRYAGYALGFIHFYMGSRNRAKELLQQVLAHAGDDGDLRIKATMILAHMAPDPETVSLIHSIDFPAKDERLAKLLLIWRQIVLRHQGRVQESVVGLQQLVQVCEAEREWYCVAAAKDALIRARLKMMDFDGARSEIESFKGAEDWGKFRTVAMQMESLNGHYRKVLAGRTIVTAEKKNAIELTHADCTVRVQQDGLRKLIELFQSTPSMTIKKAAKSLAVTNEGLKDLTKRLSAKLRELQLPLDSIEWEGVRLNLIPALTPQRAFGGLYQ